MPTHLGPRGATLIKDYEQLRLTAYKPTPVDVWTIGYGSTRGVTSGMTISLEEADRRFTIDTASAVQAVATLRSRMAGNGWGLTQSMVDALVSLVFNVGASAVSSGSTIGGALLAGNYFVAWAGFALWRKQKGRDLLGLARRRAREMALFLEDGLPL